MMVKSVDSKAILNSTLADFHFLSPLYLALSEIN